MNLDDARYKHSVSLSSHIRDKHTHTHTLSLSSHTTGNRDDGVRVMASGSGDSLWGVDGLDAIGGLPPDDADDGWTTVDPVWLDMRRYC